MKATEKFRTAPGYLILHHPFIATLGETIQADLRPSDFASDPPRASLVNWTPNSPPLYAKSPPSVVRPAPQ
jgi:hypothetical protein